MSNYELEQQLIHLKAVINRELDMLLSRIKTSPESTQEQQVIPKASSTIKPTKKHTNEMWVEVGSDTTNFPVIEM